MTCPNNLEALLLEIANYYLNLAKFYVNNLLNRRNISLFNAYSLLQQFRFQSNLMI